MQKSWEDKSDFYLALIDYRNTPKADIGLSPAERMLGRKTRGLIPAVNGKYEQKLFQEVKDNIEKSKAKQKQYYDRGARPLTSLQPGDVVHMKLPGAETYTKGNVIGSRGPRSYRVRVNGKTYVRNRRQLIKSLEGVLDTDYSEEESVEEKATTAIPILTEVPESNQDPVTVPEVVSERPKRV